MRQYILPALITIGIFLGGCSTKYKTSSDGLENKHPVDNHLSAQSNSKKGYIVSHIRIQGKIGDLEEEMAGSLKSKTLKSFLDAYHKWSAYDGVYDPYFIEIAERLEIHGLPKKGINIDIGTQPKNVLDEMKRLCHDYLRKTERSHEDFYTMMCFETNKGFERAKELKFTIMKPDLVRALFSDYELLLVEESVPSNIMAIYFFPKKGEDLPLFEGVSTEFGHYRIIIDLGGDGIDASDYTINSLNPEQIPEANRKLTEIVGKYNKIFKNRHKRRTFEDVKQESKIQRTRSNC